MSGRVMDFRLGEIDLVWELPPTPAAASVLRTGKLVVRAEDNEPMEELEIAAHAATGLDLRPELDIDAGRCKLHRVRGLERRKAAERE